MDMNGVLAGQHILESFNIDSKLKLELNSEWPNKVVCIYKSYI